MQTVINDLELCLRLLKFVVLSATCVVASAVVHVVIELYY